MNKRIKTYAVIWALFLAIFNAICFITPNTAIFEDKNYEKFGGAFWVGYIFITLAFIGQLICAYIAFKDESKQKLFYNIPIIRLSYTGLIIMLVIGGLAMVIPDLPIWAGVLVCLAVLVLNAVAVIKAKAAADIVGNIDQKIKSETAFIKELTAKAQSLTNRAKAPMLKKLCTKVYEALRYSDPMSSEKLSDIETRIKGQFAILSDAVLSDNLDITESSANELINLINERNNLCKIYK